MAGFDIAGPRSELDAMLESLWEEIQADGYSVQFNGQTLTSTGDLWVNGENWREERHRMPIVLIVIIVLLSVCFIAVLTGFLIYKFCRKQGGFT